MDDLIAILAVAASFGGASLVIARALVEMYGWSSR
jgi:hypothetical protein